MALAGPLGLTLIESGGQDDGNIWIDLRWQCKGLFTSHNGIVRSRTTTESTWLCSRNNSTPTLPLSAVHTRIPFPESTAEPLGDSGISRRV